MLRTPPRSLFPVLIGLLALPACRSLSPTPAAEVGHWQAPASGIETRELRQLAAEFWRGWIDWHPIEAGRLGDPRALGRWPAVTDHVRGARSEQVWELRTKLGLLDPGRFDASERTTYDLLRAAVEREDRLLRIGLDRWMIDPLEGPHARMLAVAREQPADTAYERQQLLERWRAFARALTSFERSAVHFSKRGFVAPRGAIDRTIEQVDRLLNMGVFDSPFLEPACGGGRWVDLAAGESLARVAERELGDPLRNDELLAVNPHLSDPAVRARGTRVLLPSATDSLSPAERGAFVASVRALLENEVQPALLAWRRALAYDLAPSAPSEAAPGLGSVPGGTALYRELARVRTTLATDPVALARRAELQLGSLEDRLYALAAETLGQTDRGTLQTLLRGDARNYFEDSLEVQNALRAHVRRAEDALLPWFLDRPATPLVVGLAPALEPVGRDAVSYRPPPAGASRPGRLLVEAGGDRQARFAAPAVAFGAGLPGRHLARALTAERPDLPLFQRYAGPRVLEVGWADYAEELSDEMGLYQSDLERVGRLSRAALRRARAVADVGLHLSGWSRTEAVAYLREHSLLSPLEIELEVDILLARPAEALAPVVGGNAIRSLRAAAEDALGEAFDVRRFHEALFAEGAVGLPIVARSVGGYAGIDAEATLSAAAILAP